MTSDAATPVHTTEVGDSGDRVVFLHGLFGQEVVTEIEGVGRLENTVVADPA